MSGSIKKLGRTGFMAMDRRIFIAGTSGVLLSAAACSHMPEVSKEDDIKHRMIKSNGINMRIAEMGEGPLVLLIHGWPESWYSWRHQIRALADAGYHVVAPDMRGYGGTDKPKEQDAYNIEQLSADVVGVVDAMGEEQAYLVGHDWGAAVCWDVVRRYPNRFKALVNMSVPLGARGSAPTTQVLKSIYGDNFFYMLYFQQPGVAEVEFDADPRGILSRLYASPDTPRAEPELIDPKMSAGGWIPRLGEPLEQPAWLSEDDLDYFVNEFENNGFVGGINYYRNLDNNWALTENIGDSDITMPVMFLAGEEDTVIRGATADELTASIGRWCKDLRGVTLLPGIGHWLQQEDPEAVNAALLSFLRSV